MNDKFREYAFARAFHIQLTERHIDLLALLVKGDAIAPYGLDSAIHGLLRRGLVEFDIDDARHRRYRVTKAGLLIYDLLVEAGERASLDETRRQTIEAEDELHRLEWEERFGDIQVKLKERHLRP